VVHYLLDKKYPFSVNALNQTVLSAAIQHFPNNLELIKRVLELSSKEDIETANINQWRPIHFAVEYASAGVVRLLLESGASTVCESGILKMLVKRRKNQEIERLVSPKWWSRIF
jgi:hypothetical protein